MQQGYEGLAPSTVTEFPTIPWDFQLGEARHPVQSQWKGELAEPMGTWSEHETSAWAPVLVVELCIFGCLDFGDSLVWANLGRGAIHR